MLKDILENAVPVTFQDVVVIFCTVSGWRKGQFVQISDARKIYGQTVDGEAWSAIQITTAAGVCAVVDLFVEGKLHGRGLVRARANRPWTSSSTTALAGTTAVRRSTAVSWARAILQEPGMKDRVDQLLGRLGVLQPRAVASGS